MNLGHRARVGLATALILVVTACEGSQTAVATDPALTRPASGAPAAMASRTPIAPADYLRLHNLAADPRDPGWQNALRELAIVGDDYTLGELRALSRSALTSSQAAALDETIAALAAKSAAASGPPTATEVQARLERAAWADLRCDRCESTLVPWATKSISQFAGDPSVRATLERIRDGYEPSAGLEPSSRWGSLSDRVRGYARTILQGGEQSATKTR
jgi:hypothetical protein